MGYSDASFNVNKDCIFKNQHQWNVHSICCVKALSFISPVIIIKLIARCALTYQHHAEDSQTRPGPIKFTVIH